MTSPTLRLSGNIRTAAGTGAKAASNVALRSKRSIRWDAQNERVLGEDDLEELVTKSYREPWRLPLTT